MPSPDDTLSSSEQAQLRFLTGVCGTPPRLERFGPADDGVAVATFEGYPNTDARTHVTVGLARHPFSLHRRRPVGYELAASVPADAPSFAPVLAGAVLENLRLVRSRERRPFIEANGVYAPGYPPHLLFTTEVTATPAFAGRHLFSDRYVYFLSTVPLDDAELRLYDRDVRALLTQLNAGDRIAGVSRAD